MVSVYRIYERTMEGARVVAQVQKDNITGRSAASVRKVLEQYGYPDAPIEDVIDQFLLERPGMGAALVLLKE